jgi:hypothetical protein
VHRDQRDDVGALAADALATEAVAGNMLDGGGKGASGDCPSRDG